MSENTNIEWANYTWSPWLGCRKISPGCLNCYIVWTAPFRMRHLKHGDPRQRTSNAYWKQPLKWNREAGKAWSESVVDCVFTPLGEPERAAYMRPRVFPSLCDVFDTEAPIEWFCDYLKLVYETRHLDHLMLTKRPEKFKDRIIAAHKHIPHLAGLVGFSSMLVNWAGGLPPSNVWIGTSVEDQQRADERIPELLKIPAKVRFLSVEPLLGPVDIALWLGDFGGRRSGAIKGIDWVIVGGESGPSARTCNLEWIRSIVKQCKAAKVPCFVKQMGENSIIEKWPKAEREMGNFGRVENPKWKHKKGGDMAEWPADLRVREFPGQRDEG